MKKTKNIWIGLLLVGGVFLIVLGIREAGGGDEAYLDSGYFPMLWYGIGALLGVAAVVLMFRK